MKYIFFTCFHLLFLCVLSKAQAQMTPDLTLPNNTTIQIDGNITTINGGTQVGNNLFHSFKDFSIPTGTSLHFKNGLDVQNIITRITGGSASNIDGLISANGTANLFLINPSGIVFGPNARLDIGGSFLATTADSLEFPNGSFSATNPQAPLLTIDIPIGLQFNGNSGSITVQGKGQGLIAPSSRTSPIIKNNETTGLSLKPNKTLVLAGGNIILTGSTLSLEQGNIELGSVESGRIKLNLSEKEWSLNYDNISFFKDIHLSRKALVNTNTGGSIAIQGKYISLSDGSTILFQNDNSVSNGIKIKASEALELKGSSPDGKFVSLIRTEALGSESGENIDITTKNLLIQGGASLGSRTYTNATGGNIYVNASNSIQLLGYSSFNPFLTSNIATNTLVSSGKSGDITLSTKYLEARDSGLITSLTLGDGNGGNVFIDATDSLKIFNSQEHLKILNSPNFVLPSYISSGTFSRGNAGSVTINTPKLFIGEKSTINTISINTGSAGSIAINTSELQIFGGEVSSSVAIASSNVQQILNTPVIPNAPPGVIKINAQTLNIANGKILVTGEGKGDAGTLITNATNLFLDNSSITGSTATGKGGNIFLNIQEILQLSNNSNITTTASGNGNGGNIQINASVIAGFNNSNITANAFEGRGGNIQINAKGLFLSPDSQITASSERGIDGTVQINADTSLNDVTAKPEIFLQTPEITSICQGRSSGNSEFFITGTGGLAPSPENLPDTQSTWQRNSHEKNSQLTTSTDTTEIVEAQGWVKNPDGSVTLIAQANVVNPDVTQSANSCNSDKNTTG